MLQIILSAIQDAITDYGINYYQANPEDALTLSFYVFQDESSEDILEVLEELYDEVSEDSAEAFVTWLLRTLDSQGEEELYDSISEHYLHLA